jgi:membrane protein YfhO
MSAAGARRDLMWANGAAVSPRAALAARRAVLLGSLPHASKGGALAGVTTEGRPPSWTRADRLALLALAALVAALFSSAVSGGGAFYYRDIALFGYPLFDAFVRCLSAGSLPLWNPYAAFGLPFFTNPSAQIFYPPTWLNLIMMPWTYYTVYIVAHFAFSGAGLYALGRRVQLSRGASLVGAATWIASGPLTSLVSFWQHLAGACWWPWALLAADRALESGRLRPALVWGACMGAPILAGSPDMALMGTVAVGAYALRRLQWRRPWLAVNRPVVLTIAAAASFSLLVSAAQWVPTLAAAVGTARASIPSAVRSFWSIHPMSLLQLVVPAPLADLPLRLEVRAALFEGREPMLPSLYLGMAAIGLVGAAFAASGHPLRWFAGLLGLAALAVALGRHTPFYEIVATVLPPLRAIRYPAKMMALVAFAWALLCGIGWDGWRAREGASVWKWRLLVVAPLSVAVVLGVIAVWLGRFAADEWGPVLLSFQGARRTPAELLAPTALRVLVATGLAMLVLGLALRRPDLRSAAPIAALVGTVAVADLALAHHDPSPLAPKAVLAYRPAAAEVIRREPHSRIFSYDYADPGLPLRQRPPAVRPETLAHGRNERDVPWAQVIAAQQRLYPSLLNLWGLEGSFDRDTLGLYPPYLSQLMLGERAYEGTPAMTKVLRMGSVSHVVALHDDGFEALTPVARLPGLLVEDVRVFRVPDSFPRVYAVGYARVADGREALRILGDPEFDPAREVILPTGTSAAAAAPFSGAARVVEWRPDRIRLESRFEQPGYLVLAESYDPGWHARVDGTSVPVLRANIGLRAVHVPAGTHAIDLFYRPIALTVGVALSALAAAAAAAAAALSRAKGAPAA